MVLDIKMCRFDNVPWGFRLVGGSDFDIPLTVVKVTEGSIAEEAGLRVGDVIVRINDTTASPLAHEEAHKIIMSCGNVFYFGIQRDEEEPAADSPEQRQLPVEEFERPATPLWLIEDASPRQSVSPSAKSQDDLIMEQNERPNSVLSERSEIKLVEEEIAAVLSGESEVLKDHNSVMGIFPKPGVCMSSDVLRTLNEEAIKTKAEKDKENKKWTTFLQKPNRPIPKSKQQLEAEQHAANAYKVKIVVSPRATSPAVERKPEPIPEPEPAKEPTPPPAEPEVEEEPPADSEVPNLEETPAAAAIENTETSVNEEEKADKEKETTPENEGQQRENETTTEEAEANTNDAAAAPTPPEEKPKTEEELALERQLADVQKQLQALSSLPSTIQSTLDAVTRQLAELLPTFKLQQSSSIVAKEDEPRDINLECIEEGQAEETQLDENADNKQMQDITNEQEQEQDAEAARDRADYVGDEVESDDPAKQQEKLERREETRQMEEELNLKKQKIELWNRLFNGESNSRAIFRVNFMKYQKPERKIDLNRSEVYKVIHHLDRKPVRGIEVRAPVVPAEIDIRKAVQS